MTVPGIGSGRPGAGVGVAEWRRRLAAAALYREHFNRDSVRAAIASAIESGGGWLDGGGWIERSAAWSRHHGWHGGIFVDLFGDTAFRMCPLTESDAVALIEELKGHVRLRGYRGAPAARSRRIAY